MSNLETTAHRKLLPQFVGYREVAESFGVSRRTIERQVEDGIIPKPLQLSPNRVGWPVDQIKNVLDERARGLMARAVSRPEDLSPEQVAPTMRELGARLISDHLGKSVEPEHITIRIENSASNEEVTNCRAAFLERLEQLCGHFDYNRALYITATLFPAIRAHLSMTGDLGPLRDPELLREFCAEILDDVRWAALQKSVTEQ